MTRKSKSYDHPVNDGFRTAATFLGLIAAATFLGFFLVWACKPEKEITHAVLTDIPEPPVEEKKATWGDTVAIIKDLAFKRETANLKNPYANHVWERGIEYFGKYAFSRQAVDMFHHQKDFLKGKDEFYRYFLYDSYGQEEAMDSLLTYSRNHLIQKGVPATIGNIWSCHIWGADEVVKAWKKGRALK